MRDASDDCVVYACILVFACDKRIGLNNNLLIARFVFYLMRLPSVVPPLVSTDSTKMSSQTAVPCRLAMIVPDSTGRLVAT